MSRLHILPVAVSKPQEGKSGAWADEGDVHRLGFVSQLYKLYDFTDFMNLSYRLANIAFPWYSDK